MPSDRRLDSWKEIAGYLGRSVRTVQRWERAAGLPVRRVAMKRGAVYAFTTELDRWWQANSQSPIVTNDDPPPTPRRPQAVGGRDEARQETSMRGRGYISHTLGVDPDSAQAQAHLSLYLLTLTMIGLSGPAEALPAARRAAQRALELDAAAPEALAALGVLAGVHDLAWSEAERYFEAATSVDSVPPLVRFYHAIMHLSPLARHAAALAELERGLATDPLFLPGRVQVALELQSLGRHMEGLAELEHVARMDPQFGPALGLLGRQLALDGKFDDARALAERAYAAAPRHPNGVGFLAGMLRRTGEAARRDDILATFARESAWALPRAVAESCVVCHEFEASVDALREAARAGDPGIWLIIAGTAGDLIRQTDGWQLLCSELRLPDSARHSRQ